MQIIDAFPPNFEKIQAAFPVNKSTVFTYGDGLFAPGRRGVSADLLEHERIHSAQQGKDPEGWWDRYIADKEFRLSQEVDAYQAQYQYFCRMNGSRNKRFSFLKFLGTEMSSAMYGRMVGLFEAMKLIES